MTYNLQQTIFTKMPIVNQTSALEIFDQMDDILEFCVRRIVGLRSTVFCLVDISAEIGSSLTHGRLIFNRPAGVVEEVTEEPKPEKVKTPKSYGSSSRFEDLLTYNNESDHESIVFLKKIFKIYNCWTAGFVKVEDILGLNLCRATYENIIQDFLVRTKDYQGLCLKFSRLREEFFEQNTEDSDIAAKITEVEDRLTQIESNVGCERSRLFSIRHQVQTEMNRYKKLKENVYHAYLRIVYKVAREKATAEQQVLENFQNGSIGLLRAISTYNPTRGVFSSYAKTWTLQHILLKLKEEANAIRLPISIWQTNNDIAGIQTRLASDANDYVVEVDVLAEESGLEQDRVQKVSDYFNSTRVVSMENQNSLDSSSQESRKEESYDPYEPLPFIDAHIDLLTPRQSFIIFLVYGMYERLPGDLPDDLLDLAKERLRQKIAEKLYSATTALKSQESS
jgi:RNA polymerase sigma factor (sigma-70 family)